MSEVQNKLQNYAMAANLTFLGTLICQNTKSVCNNKII